MAEFKLLLPAMGEGVMEATVTGWLKQIGDLIEEDESVVEIATDKVDSDVPSPVEGKLKEILIQENQVAKIGEPIAILEIQDEDNPTEEDSHGGVNSTYGAETIDEDIETLEAPLAIKNDEIVSSDDGNFYSPLVRSIADKEGISTDELKQIKGSGRGGRINKDDIQKYLEHRSITSSTSKVSQSDKIETINKSIPTPKQNFSLTSDTAESKTHKPISGNHEIIEMDRMRKLIATHMVNSVHSAPHVSSFVETDMTAIVKWRANNKTLFFQKEGEKLTYMPFIVQAIVKAIKDFPMINVSVDGDHIIVKKDINIGIATARADGNLIVPVIKNADQYNLAGLAKKINDLADRARNSQLKPDEIQGGTYTISNIGTFGNILGTPIINQPQVAIMAIGAIEKKPAVVETIEGDMIGIRHKMYLSHSYDHRVVDGALGGMFVKKVSDYLEGFDISQAI